MEWRPAGWSVCLPRLISPCTIKSRSSLLAPAHPDGPRKLAVKRSWCVCVCATVSVTCVAAVTHYNLLDNSARCTNGHKLVVVVAAAAAVIQRGVVVCKNTTLTVSIIEGIPVYRGNDAG